MKARILPAKARPVLSVGMIVKNEEKHLENCLRALQPLLGAVPSELVVADTGSTDRTAQIARAFTPLVFPFAWRGDFAAARNFTLQKAGGEWFMFIDADEYLDDPAEMVAFFQSAQRDSYNMATYQVRNYMDARQRTYQDFRAPRLCRKDTGNYFFGPIHEALVIFEPIKHFNTMAHHYGYVYETPEEYTRKQARNLALLRKALEEAPDDVRLLAHMADAVDESERLPYLRRAAELVRGRPSFQFYPGVYQRLLKECARAGEDGRGIAAAREYLAGKNPGDTVVDLDVYALLAFLLARQKRYEEALEAYRDYFRLYGVYQRGGFSQKDMMYGLAELSTPVSLAQQLRNAARCCRALGRHREGMECLMHLPFAALTPAVLCATYWPDFVEALRGVGEAGGLAALYEGLRACGDPDKLGLAADLAEECYLKADGAGRADIAAAFADIEAGEGEVFPRLMALLHQGGEPAPGLDVLVAAASWEHGCCALLYLCLARRRPLAPAQGRFNKELLERLLCGACAAYPDYPQVVMGYVRQMGCEGTPAGLLFTCQALLAALPRWDGMKEDERRELARLLMRYLPQYTAFLYAPQVFEEDLGLLPEAHRLGYFLGRAAAAGQEPGAGARFLREAGGECPHFCQVVEALLGEAPAGPAQPLLILPD